MDAMKRPLRDDAPAEKVVRLDGHGEDEENVQPPVAMELTWADSPKRLEPRSWAKDITAMLPFALCVLCWHGNRTCQVVVSIGMLAFMYAWRLEYFIQVSRAPDNISVPYPCAYAKQNDKEVFLVGTMHIAPRSPNDVVAVIESTQPDLVLIELDDERLAMLRDPDAGPGPKDLQPVRLNIEDQQDPIDIMAQRAFWNGEYAGTRICDPIKFDHDDPYSLSDKDIGSMVGKVALAWNGGPPGEPDATLAFKAYCAWKKGASALLVTYDSDVMPIAPRLGTGTAIADLRVAMKTKSCGHPPIPSLLLPKSTGETLRTSCEAGSLMACAEFVTLDDIYPRPKVLRRVVQQVAMVVGGIKILYGVMRALKVKAGLEFVDAESAASSRGIPCACVDMDVTRLCGGIGKRLMPTPRNIACSAMAWVRFPRLFFRSLFPWQGTQDVFGSALLHVLSFNSRVWLAGIVAGLCSSIISDGVLRVALSLFTSVAVKATMSNTPEEEAEASTNMQWWIYNLVALFALPRLYSGVVDARDEAMYQGLVAKSNEYGAKRIVLVVGCAHSNGILDRIRERGL